jgi:hypothetical protein
MGGRQGLHGCALIDFCWPLCIQTEYTMLCWQQQLPLNQTTSAACVPHVHLDLASAAQRLHMQHYFSRRLNHKNCQLPRAMLTFF